jgi:Na+/alanine symporter
LFGTHAFLTIRLGFIGRMIQISMNSKREGEGNVHHFGALVTALAATVGTGNIGIGNMVRANSISNLAEDTFRINPWITGSVMTVLTATVILWRPNRISLLVLSGVIVAETNAAKSELTGTGQSP